MILDADNPSQDRPIRNSAEDKLDRGPFVASLIRALVRDERDAQGKLTGRRASGLVVGLTGKWGAGKSSILRMLNSELSSMDRVIVSYFNPWLFNGRDELVRGFFSGLRDAMGKSKVESSRDLADALNRYWGSINLAGSAIAAVVDVHGGAGAATTFWKRWGKPAKDAVSKPKELSPDDERRALEKKIRDKKVAVVVLIDELDRVEDDEVKAVAQLVKAVGDIEGLSYLVAYDPDRVVEALGRGEGDDRRISGARYLEKIIQLPIPLRPLFPEDVEALLEAETGSHNVPALSARDENLQSILTLLKREISTPRDVKRLVGAYAVLELATRGEIEPIDVLAYAWMLTKSPLLRDALATKFDRLVEDASEEEMVARVTGLMDREKAPPSPEDVIDPSAAPHSQLLKLLFPRFRQDRHENADGTRLSRRRNIVRLLYLGNPPGSVPRTDVEQVWNLPDPREIEAHLRVLRDEGKLGLFLDRLDDLLPQLGMGGDGLFWPALSRVLTRSSDWIKGPEPEHGLASDAAETLSKLGMRDKSLRSRTATGLASLIQANDLVIAPWILRKSMYAHGLSKHNRTGGGKAVLTKEETLELMRTETPRYKVAVTDGTALRRLPTAEAVYVIANQEAWDEKLREDFTAQLKGWDAVSTLAALLVPPGYSSDKGALSELFDPQQVLEELSGLNLDDPTLEPWIAASTKRLRAILMGRDPHFPDEDQ